MWSFSQKSTPVTRVPAITSEFLPYGHLYKINIGYQGWSFSQNKHQNHVGVKTGPKGKKVIHQRDSSINVKLTKILTEQISLYQIVIYLNLVTTLQGRGQDCQTTSVQIIFPFFKKIF